MVFLILVILCRSVHCMMEQSSQSSQGTFVIERQEFDSTNVKRHTRWLEEELVLSKFLPLSLTLLSEKCSTSCTLVGDFLCGRINHVEQLKTARDELLLHERTCELEIQDFDKHFMEQMCKLESIFGASFMCLLPERHFPTMPDEDIIFPQHFHVVLTAPKSAVYEHQRIQHMMRVTKMLARRIVPCADHRCSWFVFDLSQQFSLTRRYMLDLDARTSELEFDINAVKTRCWEQTLRLSQLRRLNCDKNALLQRQLPRPQQSSDLMQGQGYSLEIRPIAVSGVQGSGQGWTQKQTNRWHKSQRLGNVHK